MYDFFSYCQKPCSTKRLNRPSMIKEVMLFYSFFSPFLRCFENIGKYLEYISGNNASTGNTTNSMVTN